MGNMTNIETREPQSVMEYEANDKDEVVEDVDENDNTPDPKPPTAASSLRYFGVDFDVSGLVRRFKAGDIIIPSFAPPVETKEYEGFQRQFVWPKRQMDRFIESLLLGYPVPGIFLVEQSDRKYLVLDGQQRLRTLLAFYDGEYERINTKGKLQKFPFNLEIVGDKLKGLSYATLTESDRRMLDSTLIQATIVVPKDGDMDAVYLVFERINSGGVKLQPQEIRVALYSGELIHFLRELNSYKSWRSIFGPPHTRLKDHELILRYLMLLESGEILAKNDWDRDAIKKSGKVNKFYQAGMNKALRNYLELHRNLEDLDKAEIAESFEKVTSLLEEGLGKKALRPRGNVNAAHTDALLIAMTLALKKGIKLTSENVTEAVQQLLKDEDYSKAIMESTAHLESVITRLSIAGKLFNSIGTNAK